VNREDNVLAFSKEDLEEYDSTGGTGGVSHTEEADFSEQTRQGHDAVRGGWDVPHVEEADISLDSLERWIDKMGEP
jgi:hypothetical protein